MSININDYFQKSQIQGRICDTLEDVQISQKINQEMAKVKIDFAQKSADSLKQARRLVLFSKTRC